MENLVMQESDVIFAKQIGFQLRRSICITANSVNLICVGNAIIKTNQKLEPMAGSLTMKVTFNR